MVRRAQSGGSGAVYDISGRQAWSLSANVSVGAVATAAEKRAHRKGELADTGTELIQDFAFPTLSSRVKVSADGNYIVASGVYPPQLHVYDVRELSLKFKRHVRSEIVEFQILGDGYEKVAMLSGDRGVELHSPFGMHFETRVPKVGRDLMIHRGRAELFIVGDGREAWRLNLYQGRFLAPLETNCGGQGGNNVCGISPVNSLLYFGGVNGHMDVWDSRMIGSGGGGHAGSLDVYEGLCKDGGAGIRRLLRGSRAEAEITAVRCDERDGVSFAVGTGNGFIGMFDLRMRGMTGVRDQGNGVAIRGIRMHEGGKYVVSGDCKGVKVWEREGDGGVLAGIETPVNLNHLCCIGGSGVICAAVDMPKVKSYYIPGLGHAPQWCSFLDNFTEELEGGRGVMNGGSGVGGDGKEEEVEEVYENYRFVLGEELEGLGLGDLKGTEMLKAYMHGYFVHQKLYQRAVSVSEPFAYEKYRKEKAREKMEAERESRIGKKRRKDGKRRKNVKVDVNQKVVDKLKLGKGKKGEVDMSVLEDDRFGAMFSNKDYMVDEDAERYMHLNPSGGKRRGKTSSSSGGGLDNDDDEDSDDSDEEYLQQFEVVDDGRNKGLDKTDVLSESDESEGSGGDEKEEDEEDGIGKRRTVKVKDKRKEKRGQMYQVGEVAALSGEAGFGGKSGGLVSRKVREQVSLGDRIRLVTK